MATIDNNTMVKKNEIFFKIDIRKLIQKLNNEKHVASVCADDADKRDTAIYNNTIDDAMNDLKLSINALLLNQFDFDETSKLADYEPDV